MVDQKALGRDWAFQVLPCGEGLSGTPHQQVRSLSRFKAMFWLSRGGGEGWGRILFQGLYV